MANAAFTTLCINTTTNFLRTGDPVAALGSNLSRQGLESLAINIISAGLVDKLGTALDIKTNPALEKIANKNYQPTFSEFAKSSALEAGVNAAATAAITGKSPSPVSILKKTVINAAAASVSYQIGRLTVPQQTPLPMPNINYCMEGLAVFVAGSKTLPPKDLSQGQRRHSR